MKISDPVIYEARRVYSIFALIGGVVMLLFGWELTRTFAIDRLFFFVLATAFALINLRWALIKAELTPSGLTFHEPLQMPSHVDFRQMVAVHASGRVVSGLSVVYYPLEENGLVDMDNPRTLFLPAMERQDELLSILNREIPQ